MTVFVFVIGMALCVQLRGVSGYPQMMQYIPNGNAVMRNGRVWRAVGHDDPAGGTLQLNQFGMSMKVEGMHWTADTCGMDSDGDGYTNGEELGDPDCTWVPNTIPARTTDISHPGYADSVPTTFKSRAQREAEALAVAFEGMAAEGQRGDPADATTASPSLADAVEAQLREIEATYVNGHPAVAQRPSEEALS